ncbi:octanoyltransferase [Iodidimonas nitroreducens]|uniref:Octanoyltransferase n=1 Tax=Iodidimonas nitroreducens TaxID=1236968 RepID=A0A5A7NEM4_9PROT|nr:lipoyl(octanoyl) transferase LipB [Iodidimonas nitroreducens]GER05519.1 octanoyltransferase [Iodidimonas nitroreducens]
MILSAPMETTKSLVISPEDRWVRSDNLVDYPDALAFMEARANAIRDGQAQDLVWLLEHPPLYTAGTSARRDDLLLPDRFPVYVAGRGGQYTYHGPGQRIAYVMMDLTQRGRDLRRYVADLEGWIIAALAEFGVHGEIREGRVGVWVDRGDGREDKIAAIGVRVRRWVSFHGLAINVAPDLSHFGGIVPCGIAGSSGLGVTSLQDLAFLPAWRMWMRPSKPHFRVYLACLIHRSPYFQPIF